MKTYNKMIDYKPKLRVSQFSNKFFVEFDKIETVIISSQIGGNWTPVPNFKLYETRDEALSVMNNLIENNFTMSVNSLCIEFEENISLPDNFKIN